MLSVATTNHSSDRRVIVTGQLPVATVAYGPMSQCMFVVVVVAGAGLVGLGVDSWWDLWLVGYGFACAEFVG
jgi:hypothetical protein